MILFSRRAFAFASSILLCTAPLQAEEIEADILIVGATESGWAAAIQAARHYVKKIVIVHDGTWFGGQFTEQALACVDEDKGVGKVGWGVDWHPMKRSFHRSGLFKELMDRIESTNRSQYGSSMPGLPWHGPTTFRPAEAESSFRKLIQSYRDSGQIEVYWEKVPVSADVNREGDRPRLTAVHFAPLGSETPDLRVEAKFTIDASDWGDVIRFSGAAYEFGPDLRTKYGEPSAPTDAEAFPPNEMNPITWTMIVEQSEEETPIPEPPHFDDRNYPRATHLSREAFGKLKWDRKAGMGSIAHWPDAGKEADRQLSVYSVRRIVEGTTSKDKKTSILLAYMNGQDYPLMRLPQRVVDALEATEPGASQKNIVEMTRAQRDIVFQDAKNHALGVLYHLQNFVHEKAPDKTNSFRNFHLSEEFGTADQLPPKPYIRESLRLKAMYMMREQDGRNRDGEDKKSAKERFSQVMYPDGLFSWQFHYDFHRTGRTYLESEGTDGPWIDYERPGRNTHYLSDRCVFPARSLIPEEMDGLLGAQGNVGFSSMVSSAIRLHDQRIHIGQASGAMAAVSLKKKVQPREIPYDRELLEDVRHALCGRTTWAPPLLLWPWRDLPASHDAFVAINRLSALKCLPVEDLKVDFRPDQKAFPNFIREVQERSKTQIKGIEDLTFEAEGEITRGEFCKRWWEAIQKLDIEYVSFPKESKDDADGDGILNQDDALLYTKNEPIRWAVEMPTLTAGTNGLVDDEPQPLERRFNFSDTKLEGFEWDSGLVYDPSRGYGWKRDISRNFRRRGVYSEDYRDTFLFTRSMDTWVCDVEKGASYEVTVCVGDSGNEQKGHHVRVEGEPLITNEDTGSGTFLKRSATVTAKEGKLTVVIGKKDGTTNTTLCWLLVRRLP